MKTDKRIKKITKALRDPDLKKKARRALEDELAALTAAAKAPTKKAKKPATEPSPPQSTDTTIEEGTPEEDEAANYKAASKYLRKAGHPGQPSPDDIDRSDPDLVDAYNLVVGSRTGHFITSDTEKKMRDESVKTGESMDDIKARVKAKRAAREGVIVTEEAEPKKKGKEVAEAMVKVAGDFPKKGKKAGKDIATEAATAYAASTPEQNEADVKKAKAIIDQAEGPTIVITDPEAQQPRDRWDRPIIQPPGGGKGTGYRRTTTFIDVIDDKGALIDWGRRIVVAGVAATEQKIKGDDLVVDVPEVGMESIIDRVIAANEELATSAKTADKQLKKGKIDADQHAAAHDAAEKRHKDTLNDLVQEAFKAGDGFIKAETGTRIHKLTEIWDLEGAPGLAALGDVTPSEFRDIEAYAAACAKLNVEVQAVEQFVVVDELQVGGTLDRRLRYDSPTLGRRITAIGDVKTGRVDYGMGKMCRQLAIYAAGKGYDWRKPEERVTYRTNREVGLIFHLPAGSGVCEVWEIDLKKGWEGVQLCAKVFAHRSETTQSKVGTKIATSVE